MRHDGSSSDSSGSDVMKGLLLIVTQSPFIYFSNLLTGRLAALLLVRKCRAAPPTRAEVVFAVFLYIKQVCAF